MKHIYANLKRFDVPVDFGGVNRLADIHQWGKTLMETTQEALCAYDPNETEFVMYLPEAHLLQASEAQTPNSPLKVGSQSVHRHDTIVGKNFGAFTSHRAASAVKAMGCESTIIGHCEERNDLKEILLQAGVVDNEAVNRLLNQKIHCALERGLSVLYCVGETQEEQPHWQQVIAKQLDIGLMGVDQSKVVVAYEPVWSIGPGKTPADKAYIEMVSTFIKAHKNNVDVVYGGGLKAENAQMLASIPSIDGGLIALTRFQGEIGFYPEEYLEIIRLYLGK